MRTAKNDLVRILKEKLHKENIGLNLATTKKVVNLFLKTIQEAVAKDGEVYIRDFGTFRKVVRNYRIGERKGKVVTVIFKVGKGFKRELNKVC